MRRTPIEKKYACTIDLPKDKRPGYYAQLIKALATFAPPQDRDKELLIYDYNHQRLTALALMDEYHIRTECFELYLLPTNSQISTSFTDYGFTSMNTRFYVYVHLVSMFSFATATNRMQQEQAYLQMQEYIIAQWTHETQQHYIVDTQFTELMMRIARAYECDICIPDHTP